MEPSPKADAKATLASHLLQPGGADDGGSTGHGSTVLLPAGKLVASSSTATPPGSTAPGPLAGAQSSVLYDRDSRASFAMQQSALLGSEASGQVPMQGLPLQSTGSVAPSADGRRPLPPGYVSMKDVATLSGLVPGVSGLSLHATVKAPTLCAEP